MFSIRGSVVPKALVWAFPCSILAAGLWYVFNEIIEHDEPYATRKDAAKQMIGAFNSVLGFLLIFRTTKAYGRYWECAMYLQKARGEWFNATSNLVAFCSPKPEKVHEVKKFQQQLIRLISLLFCSAMGEISSMERPSFEIIDPLMDADTLVYFNSKKERSEVIMNWIQRLVVDSIRDGTIEIAPPIVSRVFQEFSLGIVNVAAAKKINFIPFPFPYSQMMQLLLMLQAVVQPVVSAYAYHAIWVSAASSFCVILLSWCIHFISVEIEMPFGDDANDLPLNDLVQSMNDSLINLLEEKSQTVPLMHLTDSKLHHQLGPSDRIQWTPKDPQAALGNAKTKIALPRSQSQSFSEVTAPSNGLPSRLPPVPSIPAPMSMSMNQFHHHPCPTQWKPISTSQL
jgi:putative membrane protein